MHAVFHTADVQGGGEGDTTPPRVSKLRVAELSENQWITFDKYSRLVVRFLVLGQYLTQFLGVKSQIFEKSGFFFNFALVYFKNYKSQRHKAFTSVFPVQFCTILCIVNVF